MSTSPQIPPLPVGIDDFPTIRRGGYAYVDKTDIIADFVGGHTCFCSFNRPSGFGTTLMLSTIETVYDGDRSLFNGLAIEKRLEEGRFRPRPVMHLDFGKIDVRSGKGLKEQIIAQLFPFAER
ncbi:MAG: AAA family ATPase [Desulfovibrio sp.]|jgi:hypothetical protein|nr:AAA family ATPase [Desulfovibrio sp.]